MSYVSKLASAPSKASTLDEGYVRKTYETLSNTNVNLEYVAVQISSLPVREQKKFFRLLLNYIDVVTLNKHNPAMKDVVELCYRIIDVVNAYYEEQEQLEIRGLK